MYSNREAQEAQDVSRNGDAKGIKTKNYYLTRNFATRISVSLRRSQWCARVFVGHSWELCCWWQWKWALEQWWPIMRSALDSANHLLLSFLEKCKAFHLLQLHCSYMNHNKTPLVLGSYTCIPYEFFEKYFTCTSWLEYVNYCFFFLGNVGGRN